MKISTGINKKKFIEERIKEFELQFMNNGVDGVPGDEFQDPKLLLEREFLSKALTDSYELGFIDNYREANLGQNLKGPVAFIFSFGDKVWIKDLNCYGRVLSCWYTRSRSQYEVRYFVNDKHETTYLFEDELSYYQNEPIRDKP